MVRTFLPGRYYAKFNENTTNDLLENAIQQIDLKQITLETHLFIKKVFNILNVNIQTK